MGEDGGYEDKQKREEGGNTDCNQQKRKRMRPKRVSSPEIAPSDHLSFSILAPNASDVKSGPIGFDHLVGGIHPEYQSIAGVPETGVQRAERIAGRRGTLMDDLQHPSEPINSRGARG